MNRPAHLLLWMLCLAGLTACGRDTSELEAYIAEVKARKSTVVEPIPQIRKFEPFEYLAADRRDPFTPQAQDAPNSGPSPENSLRPDANRNREALEEFPLDSLRMVGTLSTQRATYALIRAPDGIVHRVAVGNYLGQNYGKITGITEAEVKLEEIIPDGFGGFMKRSASIALSEN